MTDYREDSYWLKSPRMVVRFTASFMPDEHPPRGPFSSLIDLLSGNNDAMGANRVVDILRRVKQANGTVHFIGNGGSCGIASHLAADFMKNGGFRALTYTDPSMLTCITNDLGYGSVYSLPIERFGQSGDALVAISSSGQSINIINAVNVAKARHMTVITLSGFSPLNPLRTMGLINFYIPSSRYGLVEIAHLAIMHHILDRLMGLE